ncbi:hypothetical protein BT96DRAFT_627141 [Gymnopus androsaceus JB14]|uniref:Uncharacterized protein n=1 Tax=Gymnopus androsaceus JB14 TaxID=1447944 RepID=A0A6A4IEC7_9AGAR|nr:hypothetical protein BT96DRAFT_627141 [Gymnopus androsaceus JB14]
MSSSETRVTFGTLPDPLRHFAPHHRNTRPVRSIMRRPKAFARNPAGQAHAFSNNISLDISNTVHSSYRPSSVMRASSPATHMHYVGSRKRGHSSVFSVSSAPRSPARHKRHSSSGSSTSSRSHRHATSEMASSLHGFGHKRGHSNLAHTFRSVFSPGLRRYSSTAVSSPRKLGHTKRSSADSSFVYVQSPSQEIDIPPSRHSRHNRAGSYDSASQGFLPSLQNSVSPFDLRSLGYALPSTPYPFHTTPLRLTIAIQSLFVSLNLTLGYNRFPMPLIPHRNVFMSIPNCWLVPDIPCVGT